MNITDVLMLRNAKNGDSEQLIGKEETIDQADSLLFTYLLNNFSSTRNEVSEQQPEEELDDIVIPRKTYPQILQNLFPAGKEANSAGLKGEQSINNVVSSGAVALSDPAEGQQGKISAEGILIDRARTEGDAVPMVQTTALKTEHVLNQGSPDNRPLQGYKAQGITVTLRDLGFEGTNDPRSKESISLDPLELDKYKKMTEQFQELSGKIELNTSQKTKSGEVVNRTAFFTAKQELHQAGKENADLTKNSETIVSQGKSVSQSPVVGGNGQQGLTSGQENLGEKSSLEKHPDLHSIQAITNKTDGNSDSINSLDSKNTVSYDSGKVWEQVLDILKKQELNTNKNVKELSLHLQPAELGKVQISLRMENGQLHLVLNASEQATGTILQNNIQDLKNGLTQMGVACGTFQMGDQYNEESGSGRDDSPKRSKYGLKLPEEEIPAFLGISSYFSHDGSGGRINVSV